MTLSEELTWRGFVHQTTFKDIKELDKEKRTFYFGVDPSAPSVTIGNLASMMMARQFIKYGFKPVLLVGGATGMIGDPKDNEEREIKSLEEVNFNKAQIKLQYRQVFGGTKFKMVDNYDWFRGIGYLEFLREVGKKMSMSQLLDRDFVKQRVGKDKSGLSYAEFSYSLIQGYDFLELFRKENATLQLCGSDQWGNCISGVELIRKIEGKDAHVWSCPLIINQSTGVKFGKSEGGAIWLSSTMTSVFKFYQFWLNVDDKGVGDYLKIYTDILPDDFDKLMAEFKKDPAGRVAQRFLAHEVTKLVHGEDAANRARKITEVLFDGRPAKDLSKAELKELARELPYSKLKDLLEFLVDTKLASSKSEARRLVEQKAVEVNGEKVELGLKLKAGSLVKKGKNGFAIVV